MKRVIFATAAIALLALSCQQAHKRPGSETVKPAASTGPFGQAFDTISAVPAATLTHLFTAGDTVQAILSAPITASCKHSGCWMDLDMGGGKTVHVTFAGEAFTIPLDAAGKQAFASGTAYRELIPVETLRNYARDDGMTEEEVALITEPEYAYEFVASGVIIR
jgi:hypothetical protein